MRGGEKKAVIRAEAH